MQKKTLWLALRSPVRSSLEIILKAGARVIVAIHPGDREEMRQLPEKQDREETPCAGVQCFRARRPSRSSAAIAPGNAPTAVLNVLTRFSGV